MKTGSSCSLVLRGERGGGGGGGERGERGGREGDIVLKVRN